MYCLHRHGSWMKELNLSGGLLDWVHCQFLASKSSSRLRHSGFVSQNPPALHKHHSQRKKGPHIFWHMVEMWMQTDITPTSQVRLRTPRDKIIGQTKLRNSGYQQNKRWCIVFVSKTKINNREHTCTERSRKSCTEHPWYIHAQLTQTTHTCLPEEVGDKIEHSAVHCDT